MSSKILTEISLLYVEDEPLISLDAMSVLETCGFKRIVCVYTLKAANQATIESSFDCAILDISLERGANSIKLGQSLIDQGTTVIFASGNGLDRGDLEKLGFSNFFIKPYDIVEVVKKIEELFSSNC